MVIFIGSKNPVKIEAVKEAFSKYYSDIKIISHSVESDVSDQPVGEDTFKGAENRAQNLQSYDNLKEADYYVGIEGGIAKEYNRWFAFGCMCIIDKEGNQSFGITAHFELPRNVVNRLLNGEELGYVMDDIQNQKNTKQKSGAIGYFTKGVMNRKELYLPGLISALIPFLHKEDYFI